MGDVLDLVSRLEQQDGIRGADAEEILDHLMGLTDGQVMFVCNFKGTLRFQVINGYRYEINPAALLD
jgi:hypothetical protein